MRRIDPTSGRRLAIVAAAVATLVQAGPAPAAPAFQIVTSGSGVLFGGSLSADGSTVLYTRATSASTVAVFDVATGQQTPIASTPQTFGAWMSVDGSIVHVQTISGAFELANGSVTPIATGQPFANPLPEDVPPAIADLPGGGSSTTPLDFSPDGSVVVGVGSSGSGREAFRWEADVTLGLGDLAGGAFESEAHGVSADGTTVVGWGTTAAGREAFRWRGGALVSLGDLPGGSVSSEAHGTSADGSIVVGRATEAGEDSRAFVWDDANGLRDLGIALAALGIDLEGVALRSALAISSDGRTIMGIGFQGDVPDATYPGGLRPGAGDLVWVAVIPEPTTAVLLGLGLVLRAAMPAAKQRERSRDR
ncbi:MAG: hypothetical protein IPK00_16135 [Deltaproteobacteria bacterium]|nr:hypothetical protein [Deltaproteobacteria bacterium]